MSGEKNMTWEEAVLWLRSQPDQVELVKACFYDDPLLGAAQRYYESTEWNAVRKFLLNPPGKALDLGAGRGISSYALAKDGWDTIALEPDSSDIVGAGAIHFLARQAGLDIRVEERWGEKLSFKEETFDIVYCRALLHHAKDLKALCNEVGRVLKKGGRFIATREHVISRREDLTLFLESHPLHHLYGGENAFLLSEYLKAIRDSGIELEHILNPFESDINLFPETAISFKKHLAKLLRLPLPQAIPDILLKLLGSCTNQPGRLYTFVGRKK